MGDDGDATITDESCNNGARLNLARLLSRSGQRAPIDSFLLALRCPEQFAKIPDKKRQKLEATNDALRERFSREILALIVVLQEHILTAHDSRRAFVENLQKLNITELNTTFLSRHLGGASDQGPQGAPWVPALIADHCARDENPRELRKWFARLWYAAYGEVPERLLPGQDGPLAPVTEQEIANLIDPPGDPQPSATAPGIDGPVPGVPDLARLVDRLPDAVLFVDSNSTVIRTNSTARELFDAAGRGLAGRGLLELLPSFDVKRLPRLTPAPVGEPGDEWQPSVRVTARRTDGQDLPAEVHSTRLAGGLIQREEPAGEALAGRDSSYAGDGLLMVVVRDLTGAQSVEAELGRQQRQTEMILRTVSDGVIRVDAEGRIVLVNASAAATLGYRPEELGGQLLSALVHCVRADGTPLPYAQTPVAEAVGGASRPLRLPGQVLRAKDSRLVQVDLSTAPVHEGDHHAGTMVTFAVCQPAARTPSQSRPPVTWTSQGTKKVTAEQAIELERAESSRQRNRSAEYHQLLIQVLARLDDPGLDVAERLCGSLPHTDRNDLLRSTRAVRSVISSRVPVTTLSSNAPAAPLDEAVHDGIGYALTRLRPGQIRFVVHAPPTEAEVDTAWLSAVLAQLIVAVVGTGTAGNAPVVVSAARRGTVVRIDLRGPFQPHDPILLEPVRENVRAHGGVLRTLEVPEAKDSVVVLEVPLDTWSTTREMESRGIPGGPDRTEETENSGTPDRPDRTKEAKPETQTTLTTRIRINIPGSRPIPPVVVRTPVAPHATDSEPFKWLRTAADATVPLQEASPPRPAVAARGQVGRDKDANQSKIIKTQQLVPDALQPAPPPTRTPVTSPSPSPSASSNPPPATGGTPSRRPTENPPAPYPGPPPVVRKTHAVSGNFLLTVNPVDGSEIEVCPPGERPARPVEFTAAERAEITRAARPPVPPGAAQTELPLLGRNDERERLVRLLARGRSVRLTGPAGSGRTTLLDAVAADCADFAPDGVVRLTGYHRTVEDLLYNLFCAAYDAPRFRPAPDRLLDLVRKIGAIVVVDDIEFGGAALDELTDAAPECAFLISATPDVPAPSADALVEEVLLGGLDRAGSLDILQRAVGRVLTEEESNWAGDLWFESEGLPLRFVQAGALLRQRDRLRTDAKDGRELPQLSLHEGVAPAAQLASRLSESARAILRFAVALGGEVPHQAHLPALVGDTHADFALGELLDCALLSRVGPRYRLAAGTQRQLEAAGYRDDIENRAFSAARHYAWWAGHPSVPPERVCAQADALLATLDALGPTPARPKDSSEDEENPAVELARTAALAFASCLAWNPWEQALNAGAKAAELGDVSEKAYFHHELGILALCRGQLDQARAELEAAIGIRGALADKRRAVASRRALGLITERS
nr:PAS domain-containing protein [Streptomyces geranii]